MGIFSRSNTPKDLNDEQAVERYRYMLRTAPPDAIEQAHEEAFARLTPEQRRLALEQLASVSSRAEQQNASDDPATLARLATRAEIRQPGILERLFGSVRGGASGYSGGAGFGAGLGGTIAGSLLGSVAGTVIGSAIAHSFFDEHPFQSGFAAPIEDRQAFADDALDTPEQSGSEAFGLDEGLDDFAGGGFDDV